MNTTIAAKKRQNKSSLSNLRNSGYIPAVVYGYQKDSTAIAVSERDLLKTLKVTGKNGVMQLDVDGQSMNVMLKDYQQSILKGQLIHADFLAINMSEELEMEVTITMLGEEAVKEGILQQPNREVTVKVKPSNVPDTIEVDVSSLQIGEKITVGDLRDKVNFTIMNDDDFTLVTVTAPHANIEEDEAAEEQSSGANEAKEE